MSTFLVCFKSRSKHFKATVIWNCYLECKQNFYLNGSQHIYPEATNFKAKYVVIFKVWILWAADTLQSYYKNKTALWKTNHKPT